VSAVAVMKLFYVQAGPPVLCAGWASGATTLVAKLSVTAC
jgi:hypothetical protein